ncbi:(deoxy)nucleoside triphosphate pyrophosphohydrolase [Listeria fleischmannii]|uniref:(deoxy)nucleoside triphosphate pyrophosphohydrolase n=1 Tax=Listeria fleischmannii TaxID=1069827 RepID=UPI001626712D|nr:(deoxy)nucleoside triphosphate pyrophosphohydrolase [Listeria fleischmannii]MBC1419656.1 (deoxy)nucleoside triphosphate pyrophosphohydrolase [Listeria fleischmannii]
MRKIINVVAGAIIKEEKILCARRKKEKSLGGLWEFPGGKIEVNELPEEALKREIMEEMNLELEIGEKVCTSTYTYDFGEVHLTVFYCKIIKGNMKLNDHDKILWLDRSELNSLEWAPADIDAVNKIGEATTI